MSIRRRCLPGRAPFLLSLMLRLMLMLQLLLLLLLGAGFRASCEYFLTY